MNYTLTTSTQGPCHRAEFASIGVGQVCSCAECNSFANLSSLERDYAIIGLINKLVDVTEILGGRLETVENEMGYNSDEEYS